jgi:hypothetical protein
VSVNEAAPVDIVGYCRLNYKDAVVKNLQRLHFIASRPDVTPVRYPDMPPEVEENDK